MVERPGDISGPLTKISVMLLSRLLEVVESTDSRGCLIRPLIPAVLHGVDLNFERLGMLMPTGMALGPVGSEDDSLAASSSRLYYCVWLLCVRRRW